MNNTGTQADIQQEIYELHNIHLYLLGRDGFQGQRKGQQLMGLGIVKNDKFHVQQSQAQIEIHSDTKLFAVCELKLTMRPVSGMRIMGEYTSECPGWRGDIMRSVFWKKSEK